LPLNLPKTRYSIANDPFLLDGLALENRCTAKEAIAGWNALLYTFWQPGFYT